MGDSTQTQTSTTQSQPWPEAQPYIKGALGDAKRLYGSGIGSQVYTGSTVVPFSQQTMQGMNAIQGQANQNMGGQGLSGISQGMVGSGGFTQPQMDSMSYLSKAGTNPFDLSGNAAYQAYRTDALNDVQDRVNMNASAMGRYGSGQHTSNLVSELSKAGNQMDLAQMGRLDGLNSQRFNAGQTGFENLDPAYTLGQRGVNDFMSVGSMYEDLAGRTMNDQMRIFNETQSKPWQNLAQYNAIVNGAGALGGSGTTTAQVPGQNPFLTGLGYATTGLGLLGNLF